MLYIPYSVLKTIGGGYILYSILYVQYCISEPNFIIIYCIREITTIDNWLYCLLRIFHVYVMLDGMFWWILKENMDDMSID